MIPKIIHYGWLSKDPIPKDMQMFIDGWYEKFQIMSSCFGILIVLISIHLNGLKKHLVKRNMPLQQIIYDYMRYIIMVVYTWIWMSRF